MKLKGQGYMHLPSLNMPALSSFSCLRINMPTVIYNIMLIIALIDIMIGIFLQSIVETPIPVVNFNVYS